MIASTQPDDRRTAWQLAALPGDGLIAAGNHHLLVVEVDDEAAGSALADELLNAYDAYSSLIGRGAARSLRMALATILAERAPTRPCSIALASTWDDEVAIYLHGDAEARLISRNGESTLSGRNALVATDVVVRADFDELVLNVGERPADRRLPLEVGEITAGRGVRAILQGRWADGSDRLNTWGQVR